MTTAYSISVNDWSDEKWRFVGREIEESRANYQHEKADFIEDFCLKCQFYNECKIFGTGDEEYDCELVEKVLDEKFEEIDEMDCDSYYPMMLYAYPLNGCPNDEEIVEIHRKTCLTVVEDTETDEFFLALCGGGMDLSQDIGLAYLIAECAIPTALVFNISTQPGLSQSGDNFRRVMAACKDAMVREKDDADYQIKKITHGIQKSLDNEISHTTTSVV